MAAAVQVSRLRFPMALVGAIGIAMMLYAFLYALIAQRAATGDTLRDPITVVFTPLTVETEVVTRKPPPKPERAPVAPRPALMPILVPSDGPGTAPPAAVDVLPEVAPRPDGGASAGDRDPGPLVRIEPEYPMPARQRGIEGWVVVEFTVGTAGAVREASVVASEPGTVFDSAALNAVRKWRYSPKLEAGRATEQTLEVRLDFEME